MNKIVGFTISRDEISHGDVDVFNVGLNVRHIHICGLNLYLWGIGDIEGCKVNGKYVLSFPLNDDLLDRNVTLLIGSDSIIVENDWLGAIPVFYNAKEIIVSTQSLRTLKDKKVHAEGLNNFMEFGYSILEQTMFSDVKFMRFFSKLTVSVQGIRNTYKVDPAKTPGIFLPVSDEAEVIDAIRSYVNKIECSIDGNIVIPTSGGYDSRFLNAMVRDKARVRSSTYGLSKNQEESFEVVYAKKVCELLDIKWQEVRIGDWYRYMPEWFRIFGFSTHLHGMYQIEFYEKIKNGLGPAGGASVLSGIIGDAWASYGKINTMKSPRELKKIGYTHGLNISKRNFKANDDGCLRAHFYAHNFVALRDEKFMIITAMRFKLMLLTYLVQLPEYFGYPAWTPFLNFNNVVSMLNIKSSLRKDRKWQKDFFRRNGLFVEDAKLKSDRNNFVMYEAFKKHPFEPIDIRGMSQYLDSGYLRRINKEMLNKSFMVRFKNELLSNKYPRAILYRLFDAKYAFWEYPIVKCVEMSLKGNV